HVFLLFLRRPSACAPLFPYTPLFRSFVAAAVFLLPPISFCWISSFTKRLSCLAAYSVTCRRLERTPAVNRSVRIKCAVQSRVSLDRKSTRLNSSHVSISSAVFCLKQK